jgi:hypothetical protein
MIAVWMGALLLAASAVAQTSPLLLPPAVEKQLAAAASDVTEVTLNKNMLGFAAKFMDKKGGDDASVEKMIQGLDGIYVRDYEFDKEGQYSMEDVEKLRQSFETSDWTPMVRDKEKKSGESTDVMMKMVNGESRGMFILSVEPKELSIVLILGPIKMDQLGQLKGLGGLGAVLGPAGPLGQVQKTPHVKDKEKNKSTDKVDDGDKKDGTQ